MSRALYCGKLRLTADLPFLLIALLGITFALIPYLLWTDVGEANGVFPPMVKQTNVALHHPGKSDSHICER